MKREKSLLFYRIYGWLKGIVGTVGSALKEEKMRSFVTLYYGILNMEPLK